MFLGLLPLRLSPGHRQAPPPSTGFLLLAPGLGTYCLWLQGEEKGEDPARLLLLTVPWASVSQAVKWKDGFEGYPGTAPPSLQILHSSHPTNLLQEQPKS